MNAYVVGFLRERDRVLLIEKKRPDWQVGRLNGIGGKIEGNESPVYAMRREFEEETGLKVWDWCKSAIMCGPDWIVHVFYAYGPIYQAKSITDEKILVVYANSLPNRILPNLRWLIPLSFDEQVTKLVEIRYSNAEDLAKC